MTEKDEKFFEKKMDRREFLKKAGIGGAGLALGLSGASAFFAPKLGSQEKISYGNEKIAFYGKHQAGISTPMQKNIYFVVLDLHTMDKDKIIQLFKDWTVPNWSRGNWSKKMGKILSCLRAILVKQSGSILIV